MTQSRPRGWRKGTNNSRKNSQHKADVIEEPEESTIQSEDDEEPSQKKVRWETGEEDDEAGEKETVACDDTDGEIKLMNDKVVLAIYAQHCRIGCAYYDPVKLSMNILEDTSDNLHYDTVKLLLEQVGANVILTSSRSDDEAIEVMRDFAEASGNGNFFQIRPTKDFLPAKGNDRLLSLSFLSELPVDDSNTSVHSSSDAPSNAYEFMRKRREINGDPTMQRWNANIRVANFASLERAPLCLASIGALLDHLAKVRAMADLDNEGVGGLDVRAIKPIDLEDFMQINAEALSSLQVFDTEAHATIQSDKTKEGLSLFGILDTTRTSLGRFLLKQWLLRPCLSIDTINTRHDAVECLLRPENLVTSDSIRNHLKGFRNVPRVLRIMKAGKANHADWQCIVKFTFHATLVREAITELGHVSEAERLKELVNVLDVAKFREVGNLIHETIDWEESSHNARVCVRPNIDEQLDKWKHIYNGIDSVLSRVAEQISETIPAEYTSSLNVVYFPQLGFLICVPMQEKWKTEAGIDVYDGWTFQFSSESHVYFKSEQMHDMDHHIGDLYPSIVDREIEILQTLLDKILVYEEVIANTCDACAELDCFLCFAEASRQYNYSRPVMSEHNITNIRQGRHPLQELVVDTFVPNDIMVKSGLDTDTQADIEESFETVALRSATSCLIVTGANACGKSVYLKQTALIHYMAQIGCFVPAEYAELGVVDRIFTRVQTRESVSKFQSAFMIDLNQVSLALRNSTPRSLVLLDEFGKGTVSSDGAGLFCGVIRSFLARGLSCPRVLVATHFHDIFRFDLLDPALPITFLHMQILLPESADEDEDETEVDQLSGEYSRRKENITYLYRVAEGLSLDSHAARCAQMFGLPRAVVNRAQYVSSLLSTHNLTQLLDEDMSAEEKEDLYNAGRVCQKFTAWDLRLSKENVGMSDYNVKDKLKEVLDVDGDDKDEGLEDSI